MYPYFSASNILFFIGIAIIAVIVGFLIFFVIRGIVGWIKGISQWSKNNNSPVLSAYARVVSKRISVSNNLHTDSNGFSHNSSSTSYYVTFQVENGDRLEFQMSGNEYGLIVEGDEGKLTFQGTRYKGFGAI